MKKRLRINVLIPYMDGEYYGTIFTELLKEAGRRDAILFAIQTQPSAGFADFFDYRIGTDTADGWILLTNPNTSHPASPELLEAIGATGKPVVTIGYREARIPCHSVIIDNRNAIREVVRHLVREHGHRQIAFVGAQDHIDLVERFEGYREALEESGLPLLDHLVYRVHDSLRQGGINAARQMLARGIDFTAVVASTDLNADGLIETLQAAGIRIPGDIAVVGFDDLPSSAENEPPLASVHQPIAELARTAADVLFRRIDGEDWPGDVTLVRTRFVPRASCGCGHAGPRPSAKAMVRKLAEARTLNRYLIDSYYQLTHNVVSASREAYFDFSKMFQGICRWGCLVLWEDDGLGGRQLIVRQSFCRKGDPAPPVGTGIPIERFPPAEWMPEIGDDEFVRIQLVRSDSEDLGFFILVGPVGQLMATPEVDMVRISSSISAPFLMRDRLFQQVRSIAEQLEIVSRTTNDGIWDLDLESRKMVWSPRIHDMIGLIGETVTEDADSFVRLIHPEDADQLVDGIRRHIREGEPFKLEFRIRNRQTGQYLWLHAAGDSIRDEGGKAVRMIGSLINITEKKQAEQQILHLAFHDSLTGLPNRQLLFERFKACKERMDQTGGKMGILLIDLDRFKVINDTLGHQIGDRLLTAVGHTLDRFLGEACGPAADPGALCTVARQGGDEFIVLVPLPSGDVIRLEKLAGRIVGRFQQPFMVEGLELYATASIGVAVYPEDGGDLDALTRCADIAMYRAKELGKNRYERYSTDIHNLTVDRLAMENELRRALERGEFELVYQPQIRLEDGRIFGVEALIRWRTSERGVVSPSDFIPLAEDGGLIIPIGRWVLREACRQQKKWIDEGVSPSIVSVNISASQLQQNDFADMVKDILAETGLPPQCLCLEITETAAITNWNNSLEKLEKVRDLGVRIALDDFGTGYSSLSMLKQLPIHIVKIDRSFVRHLAENSSDAAIASAIISLARTLGLTVIAEGVETEAQKERLRQEGCHCIQGYVFSKPLTAATCQMFFRQFGTPGRTPAKAGARRKKDT
jgi:diguanylate cyclase (GGDEF)-like protein/PAS domain S-box-containing protein